jgi:hypothetical protein
VRIPWVDVGLDFIRDHRPAFLSAYLISCGPVSLHPLWLDLHQHLLCQPTPAKLSLTATDTTHDARSDAEIGRWHRPSRAAGDPKLIEAFSRSGGSTNYYR